MSQMFITSFMSCSISTTVKPRSRQPQDDQPQQVSPSLSDSFQPPVRPSKMIVGFAASARANSTSRCCPYGKVLHQSPRRLRLPGRRTREPPALRFRAASSPRPAACPVRMSESTGPASGVCTCWPISTLSITVMLLNRRMFWNVRAIPSRHQPMRRCLAQGRGDSFHADLPLVRAVAMPVITLKQGSLAQPRSDR